MIGRHTHGKVEQVEIPVTCLATISSMATSPFHSCEGGLWAVEHTRRLYCNAEQVFYVALAEL